MFGHDFYDQLQLGKQNIPLAGYFVDDLEKEDDWDQTVKRDYDILYIDNSSRSQVVLAYDTKQRPVILYYNGAEDRFKVVTYLTKVDFCDYTEKLSEALDWLEEEEDIIGKQLQEWKNILKKHIFNKSK